VQTDDSRTSFPIDYDAYAPTYTWTRWAVPWVLQSLVQSASALPKGTRVLEIGCGTGNYICALIENRQDLIGFGVDISEPMLIEARSRGTSVQFVQGDAVARFPFEGAMFGLAFAVDVIHHLDDLTQFFDEAHRVLACGGELIIVTDSESTLRRRSLTRFFPEIREIELARYPTVSLLHSEAKRAGLRLMSQEEVSGRIALDDAFLARLEAKCSSGMRLMNPETHAAGMARVRAASERGEKWLSCYNVLSYKRPERA
jgi:SAM-dependent methyltransferase